MWEKQVQLVQIEGKWAHICHSLEGQDHSTHSIKKICDDNYIFIIRTENIKTYHNYILYYN